MRENARDGPTREWRRFEKYVKMVKKDVEDGKYVAWETAYREVVETMGHSKNDDAAPLQKAKYKPNLGLPLLQE